MSYQPFPEDFVSVLNSRSTILANGAVFTGTSENVTKYKQIQITVISDQASAVDGLSIQQSSNGTNWDITDSYSISANTGYTISVGVGASFFRIVYTNGGVTQTSFRLQCIFKTAEVKSSSVRPQDARSNEIDLEEVLAYQMEFNGTTWDRKNPAPTSSGNITTQNLVPAGTATASSAVELTLNGAASLSIQVTGTYTGALSLQVTLNGTTWVTVGGVPLLNLNTGGYLASITSALQSVFQCDVAGAVKARITGLAAMTGTATVVLKAVQAASMVALDSALPTGANTIGAVTVSGTAAVTMTAATTNPVKTEDIAAASGDSGTFVLGIRMDTLSTPTSAAGDYGQLSTDRHGALLTRNVDKQARTYSSVVQVTLAATAGDILAIFGNATTNTYVTKITVSGVQTVAGLVEMFLIKRSAANSAGTTVAMTAIPLDSTDAAANSVPTGYSANPTPGAAVGTVKRQHVPIGLATGLQLPYVFDFGEKGKALTLIGTAQGLCLNLNGVTVGGGVLDITIEWYEI